MAVTKEQIQEAKAEMIALKKGGAKKAEIVAAKAKVNSLKKDFRANVGSAKA